MIKKMYRIWRVKRSFERLAKARLRLKKERTLRIYIENHPEVNIFNYWWYRKNWKRLED